METGRPRVLPPGLREAASAVGFSLERQGRLSAVRVDGGWFVGVSRGEFEGGGLWWLPDGGRVQQLESDNVGDFVSLRGRHFALLGLTHLDLQRGRVIELVVTEAGPKARLLADLGAEPRALELAANGALTVATPYGVARIDPSGQVRWLSKSDYAGAFPRSIATDGAGNVYVGMNRFTSAMERPCRNRCPGENSSTPCSGSPEPEAASG
jgi:hypothetical protein